MGEVLVKLLKGLWWCLDRIGVICSVFGFSVFSVTKFLSMRFGKKKVQKQNTQKDDVMRGRLIDTVEENTRLSEKDSRFDPFIIIEILALIVTTIGVLIAYLQYKDSHVSQSEYKIYLSSEYTTLKVTAATDITATLNFDANSVSLSAYLDSVADGDTLLMTRNNETEWHKKVYFEHLGTYEVIATAVTPDGETVEASLEIKVIP